MRVNSKHALRPQHAPRALTMSIYCWPTHIVLVRAAGGNCIISTHALVVKTTLSTDCARKSPKQMHCMIWQQCNPGAGTAATHVRATTRAICCYPTHIAANSMLRIRYCRRGRFTPGWRKTSKSNNTKYTTTDRPARVPHSWTLPEILSAQCPRRVLHARSMLPHTHSEAATVYQRRCATGIACCNTLSETRGTITMLRVLCPARAPPQYDALAARTTHQKHQAAAGYIPRCTLTAQGAAWAQRYGRMSGWQVPLGGWCSINHRLPAPGCALRQRNTT
jgi:hypothetical protein